MKPNMLKVLQLRTTLVIVAVLCVSSQAFKLPINLKRSMKDAEHQDEKTQLQENGEETLDPVKELLFPEKPDDNEEKKEYKIQLSYRTRDDISGEKPMQGDHAGLERFYKYSLKSQPTVDQVIIFPEEGEESVQAEKIGENDPSRDIVTGSRSEGNLFENILPGIEHEEFENNSSYAINFKQSLEILAQMVRQLLFRGPVTGSSLGNNEPTIQTYDTSSEVDVKEQSLYSGPKLRTQSTNSECPDGTKRNRNGSCQKPSRRLIS